MGLMKIEHLFRYPALAVGLNPSAIQSEARLRGLYRIIYSKTISPRLYGARPICAGATLRMRAEALPERVEAPAGLWRAHR